MLSTLSLPLVLLTIFALTAFTFQRLHILMCLLSLEASLLSLAFSLTFLNSSLVHVNMFYSIVILSFGACEAAVALATLVLITRAFGSDLLSSVTSSKC